MKKLFIVDRIEGEFVILETYEGEMINQKRDKIEGNVKEGDCLIKKNNYFIIDKKATEDRKKEMKKKVKGMWE